MKTKLSYLKELIRESLHGIPEFAFRQATDRFIDELRQQMFRHVLVNKSENPMDYATKDDLMVAAPAAIVSLPCCCQSDWCVIRVHGVCDHSDAARQHCTGL